MFCLFWTCVNLRLEHQEKLMTIPEKCPPWNRFKLRSNFCIINKVKKFHPPYQEYNLQFSACGDLSDVICCRLCNEIYADSAGKKRHKKHTCKQGQCNKGLKLWEEQSLQLLW